MKPSSRPRGPRPKSAVAVALAAAIATSLLATPAPASAQPAGGAGAVFTASNDAVGNHVLVYDRDPAGGLTFDRAYATGGNGSGAGLGNQGGLVLDRSGGHLLVVNAGSDTLSAFSVGPKGLELDDVAPTGGTQPISVTVHGDLVYVLESGGDGGIAGLRLDAQGHLTPLAGSARPLSDSAPGPAQIAFTPDGRFLVVTEKGTSSIVTYAVGKDGLPGPPVVTRAAGMTPFGFSFGRKGRLLVSEAAGGAAGLSTVSSYEVLDDGHVDPITAALPTMQSAACWLVTTKSGRHAYVTNTASASVTGLEVANDGALHLLQRTGSSADSGAGPIDAGVSRGGRFLYVLSGGDHELDGYSIGSDGSLTPLRAVTGLPEAANGLAAL